MTITPLHIPQSDPPRPAAEILPTMYDLPSENPEEPGLPDEFHDHQPELLSITLKLADYGADNYCKHSGGLSCESFNQQSTC